MRLAAYRLRMAMTTIVQSGSGRRAQPEHLFQAEEALRGDQQEAGQDDADLTGYAVVECEHLGSPLRRYHVVEGAPGGVREPALGRLLGPAHEDGCCGAERDDPHPEPGQVDDGQQQCTGGDPNLAYNRAATSKDKTKEVAVTPVWISPFAVANSVSSGNALDIAVK